uniref:Uncharacterized protein n=1 Tax=Opuntia streptacantha TaxID=393608 RepID=A0A7C9F2P0_OPUST
MSGCAMETAKPRWKTSDGAPLDVKKWVETGESLDLCSPFCAECNSSAPPDPMIVKRLGLTGATLGLLGVAQAPWPAWITGPWLKAKLSWFLPSYKDGATLIELNWITSGFGFLRRAL